MTKNKIVWTTAVALGVAAAAYWWTLQPKAAAAAAAGGAAAPGASAPNGAAAGRAATPQTVTLVAAVQRDVPVTLEAAGTVVALNSVELRPKLSSTVREVPLQEGQMVKRGQVLFSFDDRAERANVERLRAQVQRDRATLADLNRQFKRARELREQNFISQSAVDTLHTQVDAQDAALRASDAALKAGEVTLGDAVLRAPMNGRAGAVTVMPGSLVQPSGAALVTIAQMDPIGVSFNLPEAQLAGLLRGAGLSKGLAGAASGAAAGANTGAASGAGKAGAGGRDGALITVTLPSERPARAGGGGGSSGGSSGGSGGGSGGNSGAALAASGVVMAASATANGAASAPANNANPPGITGRVSFIDNGVDPATGTIRVKGSLPNAGNALWPGQYVTVKLTLRTIPNAIVIPQAALIIRGNERSVYVAGPDNTAVQRVVQMRQALGEMVAVEGLAPGDKVVVEGKQNLRPGTPLREAAARGGKGGASGAASNAASGATSGAAQ